MRRRIRRISQAAVGATRQKELHTLPVLGHAFVGLATALATRPAAAPRSVAQFWAPLVVLLAYLPDILTQAAAFAGFPHLRQLAHSIPMAVIVSLPIGIAIAKIFNTSRSLAFAITFGSLLVHVVLDLLQATDGVPWWPLSHHPVGFSLDLIPTNTVWEAVTFGLAFVVFVCGFALANRLRGGKVLPATLPCSPDRISAWPGRALVLAIVLFAGATHYLRGTRESVFANVRTLLEERRFEAALALLPEARRWPSTAKPGRIDYAMAEAYQGLGNLDKADEHYRSSYAQDGSFFWAVADHALMIARSDAGIDERRSRAAPLIQNLREEFVGHPAQTRMLAKIERALETD